MNIVPARKPAALAAALALALTGCGGSAGASADEARTYVEQTYGGSEWDELTTFSAELERVFGTRADGSCVAVEFKQAGRDLHDTAFVRWDGERWIPQDIITGPVGMDWVDEAGDLCYVRPEG